MEDYNVEDRLITKDDWEEWLNKKGQKETGEEKVEWHPYPQEKPSNGIKLAKVKNTLTNKVDVRRYLAVRGRFYSEDYTHIIAWAEPSESYNEEKTMNKIKINKKADEIIIVVSRLARMSGISSQEILDNIMEEYKKTEGKKLFTAEETDSIINAFESMHGYSTDKLITAYSSMRNEKDNKLEIFEGMLLSIYFMLSITNPELFDKYEEENND